MIQRSAVPSATYRLQLHRDFTFADAADLVPYLQQLGISHLYLSPILTARAGSMHFYDVVDHGHISEELGGEAALRALAARCHEHDLGIIVDIVPNHMAVGTENRMWLDVLEHGSASIYATMFDIDFACDDPDLKGKIVVPVLGEPYGQALADGKLELLADPALGKLAIAYGPHRFPLRPEDAADISGGQDISQADLTEWRAPRALHALLERQHFRLCWWRAAGDVINWRRFFDINELAGLRIEDAAVFQRVHGITLRLYAEGIIDGVRVDHIDGLADPAAYAHTLRAALVAVARQRPPDAPADGPYIVVEKILGCGEELPAGWGVDGTSGYDFMAEVNALQHAASGEAALDAMWRAISGRYADFDQVETAARLEVLRGGFAGQLVDCARCFTRLARGNDLTRDLTEESFRRALATLIGKLRLYRSYATGRADTPQLAPDYAKALAAARHGLPADAATFEFLEQTLAGQGDAPEANRANAVRRLNQLTAPVAAKAVEDTAFYRYGRLLSRNDVGFEAARLAIGADQFLASGAARAAAWPRAMLATATHDHKRGEDVRARLAVLSELPDIWRNAVGGWMAATAATRPEIVAPDDAYTLFQTLAGAWPLELAPDDTEGLAAFCERVAGWRQKSLREAKMRSSWAAPDEDYEATNIGWLESLLNPLQSAAFLRSLHALVGRIAPAGAVNGVVQAALRCAWPGVPDTYQGTELWDFSLVDPDNRRPVDYAARKALLRDAATDWISGAAKQQMIGGLLALRRENPLLFQEGTVEPVRATGGRAGHIMAFRRRHQGRAVLVGVLLHVAEPVRTLGVMPEAGWWDDTMLEGMPAHDLFATSPVYVRR
jgi:(1->4)-alpha-D-glucan 1-alpha-D-glucosylmutase